MKNELKQLLSENLSIKITKEHNYYGKDLLVRIFFDGEEICRDLVEIEQEKNYYSKEK